jgi:hypothetical protein
MFWKKDNFLMGLIMGVFAPVLGILVFKMSKFSVFTLKETYQFMMMEPGYKTLTAALSISLLANAILFTIYINSRKDKTAKGIFATTLVYGLIILSIKTFL